MRIAIYLLALTTISHVDAASRTRKGLQVIYDFSGSGSTIQDRSGIGSPLNLRIADLKKVRRVNGSLEIREKTIIRSDGPATKLINAIRRTNEITIEAWLRTSRLSQNGPARVVTLSKNPNERNFTLGQERDQFEVRLRTTRTSTNGMPALRSSRRSLTSKLTHVVYTRDRSGRAIIYVNGKRSASRSIGGIATRWDGSLRLALANELSGDRPWLGTLYLVAIYNRDLNAKEVEENYKAGAGAKTSELWAQKQRATSKRLFETQIVPLLAKRCLECHGWSSTRGRLDLSQKSTAIVGGKNGSPIVAGSAEDSLLWKSIQSNEMPKKRTPLTSHEKRLVREWIDTGAVWSVKSIQPRKRESASIWLRRLTVNEYIETVRVALGVDVEKDARKILPRDLRADGFSNTAYNLNIDLGHVEAYSRLSQLIVARLDVAKFASQFEKKRDLKKLIASMGKWILRGPLSEAEIDSFQKIAQAVVKEGGDFNESIAFILEAMLQSPRFLYRVENQKGTGQPKQVGEYELASRLSYILWGAPPDQELMRLADSGALSKSVEAQITRMLKDPRAIKQSTRFVYEWLDLGRLDYLRPNPKRFPKWNPSLANDMRAETLAFFKEIVWNQKRPLSELMNAQITFATPKLASHYGLKPKGEGLQQYDVSKIPSRGGLLTQGSVLTIGGDEASMVARGLFVLHDLLDSEVGDPPPCVDTTPVPTKKGLTQRGVALTRLANASCTGCHSKFEPLAFGLEKFDGLGAFHEVDHHGNKLREDGEILFPGTKKAVSYQTSKELMDLLAKSERVRECITRKVAQWALGRPLLEADEPSMKQIHLAVKKGGGTYMSLMRAILKSDLVQKTRTEK